MEYACKQVGEYKPDKLIAGNTHPIDTKGITLSMGSGTYLRGTLINRQGTICNIQIVEEEEVLDQPIGILTDDINLSETDVTKVVIYISGEFRASEIIVGDDVTIDDFERDLRILGIFLKW